MKRLGRHLDYLLETPTLRRKLRVLWCHARGHHWSFDLCMDCFLRAKTVVRGR